MLLIRALTSQDASQLTVSRILSHLLPLEIMMKALLCFTLIFLSSTHYQQFTFDFFIYINNCLFVFHLLKPFLWDVFIFLFFFHFLKKGCKWKYQRPIRGYGVLEMKILFNNLRHQWLPWQRWRRMALMKYTLITVMYARNILANLLLKSTRSQKQWEVLWFSLQLQALQLNAELGTVFCCCFLNPTSALQEVTRIQFWAFQYLRRKNVLLYKHDL